MFFITNSVNFWIIWITIIWVGSVKSKRDFYITIDTCDMHSFDPSRAEMNCSIGKIDNRWTVTSYINTLKEVDKYGVSFAFSVYPSGDSPMTLLNKTIEDICPYMNNPDRPGDLAMILFKEFISNGHVPKCPIKRDLYYIKDFSLSPELLPPYVPETNYRLELSFRWLLENGRLAKILGGHVTGSVKARSNSFWKKIKKD